jgi:hypothetical protein
MRLLLTYGAMQGPHGYPLPPPPSRSNSSTLLIVLLVIGGFLVVGGGACGVGALAFWSVPPTPRTGSAPDPSPAATPDDPTADEEPKPTAPTVAKPAATPNSPVAPKKGPRTVDFVCPQGKPPAGTVRGGCLCGSEILGTACGSRGFTDVVATAKGCRFTCD